MVGGDIKPIEEKVTITTNVNKKKRYQRVNQVQIIRG